MEDAHHDDDLPEADVEDSFVMDDANPLPAKQVESLIQKFQAEVDSLESMVRALKAYQRRVRFYSVK